MHNNPRQQEQEIRFPDQRQLAADSGLNSASLAGCMTREEFLRRFQCQSLATRQISAKGSNACDLILEAQAICKRLHNVNLIDPIYQLPKLHQIADLDKPFEISIVLEPIIQLVGNNTLPASCVNKWDLIIAHCAAYVMHGRSIIGFSSILYQAGMLAFYPGVGIHSIPSDNNKNANYKNILISKYFS